MRRLSGCCGWSWIWIFCWEFEAYKAEGVCGEIVEVAEGIHAFAAAAKAKNALDDFFELVDFFGDDGEVGLASVSGSKSRPSESKRSLMTVRGLRISWAISADSIPSVVSFSLRRRDSSVVKTRL